MTKAELLRVLDRMFVGRDLGDNEKLALDVAIEVLQQDSITDDHVELALKAIAEYHDTPRFQS